MTGPGTDSTASERDYVLGTHDAEVERLGLQHQAWRSVVLECWECAGIGAGQSVIDVGAGPGYAAFDLAQVVGPNGSVCAVERSHRFVEAGQRGATARGLDNITYVERDLMTEPLPEGPFDAAWCRWVCSFVESPATLIAGLARVVRPGGVVVFHEYVDYAAWRFSPENPLMDAYVAQVMRNWRAAGGEPDIAMRIPPLLQAAGFEITHTTPRVFSTSPGSELWTWIATFVRSNLDRLEELGSADAGWLAEVRRSFDATESDPDTIMLTPAVLEIVAVRT